MTAPERDLDAAANCVAWNVPDHDELLTLEDVAQILKASGNTVRWWRQTGTVKPSP